MILTDIQKVFLSLHINYASRSPPPTGAGVAEMI
jgi:hypothetical protein